MTVNNKGFPATLRTSDLKNRLWMSPGDHTRKMTHDNTRLMYYVHDTSLKMSGGDIETYTCKLLSFTVKSRL